MKEHFILITVLMSFYFNINYSNVYICKGKGSKRYHFTKSCRGLSNCSSKVYEISLSKAKEMGRTLCGWED